MTMLLIEVSNNGEVRELIAVRGRKKNGKWVAKCEGCGQDADALSMVETEDMVVVCAECAKECPEESEGQHG